MSIGTNLAWVVSIAALGGAASIACDGASRLAAGDVAGRYRASVLTTEHGGVVTDHLASGATITLRLGADGSLDGQLHVPALGAPGHDAPLTVAGTWTLTSFSVHLDDRSGSILGGVELVVFGRYLTGTFEGAAGTMRVQLVRPA